MSPAPLSVSIVLCTFERPADLLATLASIRQARVPENLALELIVVDSSRDDATRRALEAPGSSSAHLPLRVIHEPRRGKAHALNTGVAAAGGEILLFTDDDIRVPPDWIEAMTRPLRNGEADAVAGGIHLAPALLRPWMEPLHRGWMASTDVLDPARFEVLTGANMALARRVLARVPLLDPELGAGSALGGDDETLFSFQVREAGYRLVSAFDSSVEHHFDPSRLSRQAFLDRARIEGQSSAYIAHHWRHETITFPRRRWLSQRIKLQAKRWFLPRWKPSEGAPVWELNHLFYIHFFWQYARERHRPRLYSKRGLVKQGAATARPGLDPGTAP